jgi:uncharacterized membrane protein YfcA
MLGSGGSILTVPVLVYLVGQPEKLAIAGSLAIVGGISLIAVLPYAWRREVDWHSAIWFGAPGMLGAWLGAHVSQWLRGDAQLLLFALIMLIAAWRMFRHSGAGADPATASAASAATSRLAMSGLAVGLITGLVGVGGGFLVVPALVLLVGLPMRRAVATSLVVISTNSLSGFLKYLSVLKATHLVLDWHVIATFVLVGGGGTLAGNMLGARLPQARLRQGFAVLLVCMASLIIIHESGSLHSVTGGLP